MEVDARKILQRFKDALEAMADNGKFELAEEGHKATGQLIASIEPKVTKESLDLLVGAILANDYGLKVDTGTPASEVPTEANPSEFRKYLLQLLDWTFIIEPNIRLGERNRWVRNTAKVHSKEGIPTKASVRFSKNGRRKGWIKHSFDTDKARSEFEQVFELFDLFQSSFFLAIDEIQKSN